jgi:hypothetical protein
VKASSPPGTGDTSTAGFWQVLVAGIPALVVFAIPGILFVSQGRKATRLGHKDGRGKLRVASK